MRLWRVMDGTLDEARVASGDLLELPSLLHGPPETGRHRGPHRTLHQEVRPGDGGQPQATGRGPQEEDPRVDLRVGSALLHPFRNAVAAPRPGRSTSRGRVAPATACPCQWPKAGAPRTPYMRRPLGHSRVTVTLDLSPNRMNCTVTSPYPTDYGCGNPDPQGIAWAGRRGGSGPDSRRVKGLRRVLGDLGDCPGLDVPGAHAMAQ